MHVLCVKKAVGKYLIEPGDELVRTGSWANSLPEALVSYCRNNPEENIFYASDGSNREEILKSLEGVQKYIENVRRTGDRLPPLELANRFAEQGFDMRPSGDLVEFSDDDTEPWVGGSLTFELPNVIRDLNGLANGHKIIINPNPQYGVRIICAEQGPNAGNSRLDIDIESRGAGGVREEKETQQSGLGIACFPPAQREEEDLLPQTMGEAVIICNLPVAAGSGPVAVLEDAEVQDCLRSEQQENESQKPGC